MADRREEARQFFIRRLLQSPVGRQVAQITLFGSSARGEDVADSDIDLYIVALESPERVGEVCDALALETALRFDEVVEPVVGCVDEFREQYPPYFFQSVLRDGQEVYRMDEESWRQGEAANFLALATEYLEQSRDNLPLGHYRLLVDGAYNAAELCVKGLLRLKGEPIPKRHGRIVQRFSRLYVLSGELPREMGRRLNRGLRLRNRARYEYHAEITERDAREMLELAESLVRVLEERLAVWGERG